MGNKVKDIYLRISQSALSLLKLIEDKIGPIYEDSLAQLLFTYWKSKHFIFSGF